MKLKLPTHDEHLVLARHFHALRANFRELINGGDCFPRKRPISTAFRKVRHALDALQNELDNEFHAVTSDEQFSKSGHVYYGCS